MTNQQKPEALHHTKYLTVVYRDIKPGDEARELIMHPKMTASSWSHVMNERDRLQDENANLNAGYAAARLEIESLQARIKTMAEEHADELMVAHLDGRMRVAQPAGAQQPDTAYAELPSYEHQRAIMEAERNASLDEYSRIVPLTSTESMIYERAFTNGWNRHASHGQAPAQAAPAAMHSDLRARCVELLAWRRTGTLPGEALRTLAREKYGDRYDALQRAERDTETEALNLVAAAPATQPAPQQEAQEPVAWYVTGCCRLLDEDEAKAEARHIGGTARAIPLYTAPQADSVQDLQPVHDAVTIDLLNERVAYLERKLKEADSVLEDAERYRLVRRGQHWSVINGIGDALRGEELDAAVDAARAAQEEK